MFDETPYRARCAARNSRIEAPPFPDCLPRRRLFSFRISDVRSRSNRSRSEMERRVFLICDLMYRFSSSRMTRLVASVSASRRSHLRDDSSLLCHDDGPWRVLLPAALMPVSAPQPLLCASPR